MGTCTEMGDPDGALQAGEVTRLQGSGQGAWRVCRQVYNAGRGSLVDNWQSIAWVHPHGPRPGAIHQTEGQAKPYAVAAHNPLSRYGDSTVVTVQQLLDSARYPPGSRGGRAARSSTCCSTARGVLSPEETASSAACSAGTATAHHCRILPIRGSSPCAFPLSSSPSSAPSFGCSCSCCCCRCWWYSSSSSSSSQRVNSSRQRGGGTGSAAAAASTASRHTRKGDINVLDSGSLSQGCCPAAPSAAPTPCTTLSCLPPPCSEPFAAGALPLPLLLPLFPEPLPPAAVSLLYDASAATANRMRMACTCVLSYTMLMGPGPVRVMWAFHQHRTAPNIPPDRTRAFVRAALQLSQRRCCRTRLWQRRRCRIRQAVQRAAVPRMQLARHACVQEVLQARAGQHLPYGMPCHARTPVKAAAHGTRHLNPSAAPLCRPLSGPSAAPPHGPGHMPSL